MLRRNLAILLALTVIFSIAGYNLKKFTVQDLASSGAGPGFTRYTPIIDPGHGGFDPGTKSVSGALEKDINLAIGLKTDLLMRYIGLETVMTRNTDSALDSRKADDIRNRAKMVNSVENGVLLSIHQNHFDQSRYYGAQVFYNGAGNKNFADTMQEALRLCLDPNNTRESKATGNVYLLGHAQKPAVLVECGFLSNPGEDALLQSEGYQLKIAMAITKGFLDFMNGA